MASKLSFGLAGCHGRHVVWSARGAGKLSKSMSTTRRYSQWLRGSRANFLRYELQIIPKPLPSGGIFGGIPYAEPPSQHSKFPESNKAEEEKAEEEPEPFDILSEKPSCVEEHIAKAEQTTQAALGFFRGHGFGARLLRDEAEKIYQLEVENEELVDELEDMIAKLSEAKAQLKNCYEECIEPGVVEAKARVLRLSAQSQQGKAPPPALPKPKAKPPNLSEEEYAQLVALMQKAEG